MIRKLSIPIVIFSVSLMTVPTGAAEETTSSKMSGVITTEKGGSVNIRAEDGVNSDLIGKAKTGDTVHILGTSGEWYKVDLGNDKVGYVRKDYVKLSAEDAGDKAADTDSGDSQDKEGEMGVVTGTSVNIRAGKGTDSNAIGKAKKGDKLQVLDSSGEWYKVELDDGKVGYVLGNYLKLGAADATKEAASSAKEADDTGTKETGVVVTKTGELNIRAGMSKDDKIVGTAKKGSKIHVLKKTGEWYKVQLDDGTTGYANRSYIKLGAEGADSEATSASKSDQKDSATKAGEKTDTDAKKPVKEDTLKGEGVVSTKGSPANVRASGSLKAEVVAKVDKGAKVQVVAKAGDWYKVELDDGTMGYVQRNLIKLGNGKTLLSLPADSGKASLSKLEKAATGGGEGEVVTQGSPLNVRTDKSTEAKVVGKVAKGSKVRILGKEGEWYKVQLKNGKIGYASSQFIQPGAAGQETAGAADAEGSKGNLGKGDSGMVVTKGSPLNIRSGKSQSAEVVTKAAKGSKVRILEDAGEWYKIELEDGTTGYAKRDFIK